MYIFVFSLDFHRHGYKFYAPCYMLCMFTEFVSNEILSIIDKVCRHCPGNCVSVGSFDSGANSTESHGSTS